MDDQWQPDMVQLIPNVPKSVYRSVFCAWDQEWHPNRNQFWFEALKNNNRVVCITESLLGSVDVQFCDSRTIPIHASLTSSVVILVKWARIDPRMSTIAYFNFTSDRPIRSAAKPDFYAQTVKSPTKRFFCRLSFQLTSGLVTLWVLWNHEWKRKCGAGICTRFCTPQCEILVNGLPYRNPGVMKK